MREGPLRRLVSPQRTKRIHACPAPQCHALSIEGDLVTFSRIRAENAPSPRIWHAAFCLPRLTPVAGAAAEEGEGGIPDASQDLVIFGGQGRGKGGMVAPTAHVLDVQSAVWRSTRVGGAQGPGQGYGAATAALPDGSAVVCGGWNGQERSSSVSLLRAREAGAVRLRLRR